VRVRVTPKSSKDALEGVEQTADGPAFRVKVRAAPTDGQANTAVRAVLADWLDVAKTRIELVAGGQSRVKSFAVSGGTAELENLLVQKSGTLKSNTTPGGPRS
jgi:uncharacterized protein